MKRGDTHLKSAPDTSQNTPIEAGTVIDPAPLLTNQQGAPPTSEPALSGGGINRVLSNTGANIARQASGFLVVLILPPLLVRSLDRSTYAIWLLVLQVASYVILIDNGIQTVVARYVALERSTSGSAGVARVVSNATVLLGIIGVITIAASLIMSPAMVWLIPEQSRVLLIPAQHALIITMASSALALPFSSLAGMFAGEQRAGINAFAATIGKLIGSAAVAVIALRHGSLEGMALALALGTLAQSLLYVATAHTGKNNTLFSWALIDRAYLFEILIFSFGMLASQLAGLLISGIDLPLVSAFDFAQTAYYGLALTASNLLLVPFAALTGALMPVITSIHAKGQAVRLGDVVIRTTRYGNVLLALVMLILGTSMPVLLQWWVRKPDYAQHVLPLAEILIAAQTIRLSCSLYSIAGFSAGRQKQMLTSPIGEGLVNLFFSILGAKLMGAAGVAWGSLIGAITGVLLHVLVNVPRTQDVISMDRRTFVQSAIIRPFAVIGAATLIFFSGHHWLTSPMQILLLAALSGAAAIALTAVLVLDAEERQLIRMHVLKPMWR